MCQQKQKEMSNKINISNIVVSYQTEQTTKYNLSINGTEYWAEVFNFKNCTKKYVKMLKVWGGSKNAPIRFRNELENLLNVSN